MARRRFNADDIIAYWFKELKPEDWFSGSAKLDEAIKARFLPVCLEVLAGNPDDHIDSPRSALAAILVLDQFTRNVYRGTAEAFSGDQSAIAICHIALERRYDEQLTPDERQFLYMPLQHSEILADQELSVKKYSDLGGEEAIRYAVEHRDIIARFGRFPHRNRALGRTSTPEELEFLEDHDGFGQK
ncbi:DUF924 family protein [Mesorhizobium xinjiangense]|uniref:DUF924 family protein n=1 Tax=Mesorhizobium xinjiangense TaxID=2678685 RepID=UPI0012ED57BA|nr:DUF924 family protein [Mesorhizobium xinjiangense]